MATELGPRRMSSRATQRLIGAATPATSLDAPTRSPPSRASTTAVDFSGLDPGATGRARIKPSNSMLPEAVRQSLFECNEQTAAAKCVSHSIAKARTARSADIVPKAPEQLTGALIWT